MLSIFFESDQAGCRLIKTILAVLLVIAATTPLSPACARTDLASELKAAQASLAAGDYDKAYPQYLQFAGQDNPLAQFTVAMFHQFGWGSLPVDPAVACNWFEKSAEGDIPTATHYVAECFERGIGRPANPAQAAVWYERAAGLGHYMSLCALAELYMKGEGVKQDPQQGLELCRQAAGKGATSAYVQVGRYQLEGDARIRNYEAAHRWFEAAADTSPEAQYYLGVMHRDGLGQEPAPAEARYWFERAASSGYVPAYFQTARLYYAASPDYPAQRPPADDLAKTYMWLTATLKRSQDAGELEQSQAMLTEVLAIMPATWVPDLDARVAEHLSSLDTS